MFKLQIFKNRKLFKEYKIGDTLNKVNIVNAIEKGNNETSTESLFNAKDKKKLDEIEERANNYSLPIANENTLGGVKTGSNITNSNGTISLTSNNVKSALGLSSSDTMATQSWVNNKINTSSSLIDKIKNEKYLKIFNNQKWYNNCVSSYNDVLNFNISDSGTKEVYLHNGKYKIKIREDGNKHHYADLYKINGNSEILINEVNVTTDTNDNNFYTSFNVFKISENAAWIFYYFYNGAGRDAWDAAESKKTNLGNGSATYAICPYGGFFWRSAYINTSGILALGDQYTYVAADNGAYNSSSNPNPVCHGAKLISAFGNTDLFVIFRSNDTYSKYTDPDKTIGLNWYISSSAESFQAYKINRDTGVISGVGDAVSLGTEYKYEVNSNGAVVSSYKNKTSSSSTGFTLKNNFYTIRISGSTIYIERIKVNGTYLKYHFPIIFRYDQTYANNAEMTETTFNNYQYACIGHNAAGAALAPSALKIETGNYNTGAYTKLIVQDLSETTNGNRTYIPTYFQNKVVNIIYINNKSYFLLLNDKGISFGSSLEDKDLTLSYRNDWYDYYFDLYTVDVDTKKILYVGKVSELLEKEAPWTL